MLMPRIDTRAYAIKIPGLIRLAFALLVILAIIPLNIAIARYLNQYAFWIYSTLEIIGLIFVLFVIHRDRNASYVLAWSILILAIPVAGLSLYLLWGRRSRFKKDKIKINRIQKKFDQYTYRDPELIEKLIEEYPLAKVQANFLYNSGFPVYQNTNCEYFPLGEEKFVSMFSDLHAAKKFIFMEYFILADGILWQEVEDILIQKARDGVDVRLLFDDFEMEITWLRDRKEPYDLEDNEIHLCFRTEKYDEALAFHREQGVVVLENENMGVYFIEDHDGYWIEIAPYRD